MKKNMEKQIDMSKVQAIILAAGKGTRMKATVKNKVMYEVGGKPMISFPVTALKTLGIEKPIVVVGFAAESVHAYLGDTVTYALQKNPQGTADAVRVAMPYILPSTEHVIVLYGDHATFYTPELLTNLLECHIRVQSAMMLITTFTDPTGYGRILRNRGGKGDMIGIVEEKNATEEQKKILEISTGNAVYTKTFLEKYLPQIERNPVSGEFYFTDIVGLGFQHHEHIETYVVDDPKVAIGINTPEQLTAAEQVMIKQKGL